ncbi:acyl-CoA-binding domain-containing protein 6 [Plakobranchus ocellatus]|uniref:Acyl-CoA-binding domain-containing protein 6 n=1 Tax=Plakobranchus ocellatus TaxID=259542 RepID=A0AAV3YE22_9GAST|nr:acyl-CoA-binding domain-containing protein 6 [Plakobranchus ocellatus]
MTAEEILLHERPAGHEEMLHWYNKFRPGLWRALQKDKPDLRVVERLLRSWCGLKTVKNGQVVNMKSLVQDDAQKLPILVLLEKYEHTTKLALALLGGLGYTVRQWVKKGRLQNCDVNTRDITYQVRYPDFPESSQPLVAAVWETNNYDAVKALLDLGPDTGQLYYTDKNIIPWPASFQLFRSPKRPKDFKIIHRVLKATDMSLKNARGQTLLFQAIETEESLATVSIMLEEGVNIAARDNKGRTARDFALKLGRSRYAKAIDNHVIQLVRGRKFPQMEQMLLDGYDNVKNIMDPMGRSLEDIAKRFSSEQVYELVRQADAIKQYAQKVFRAVEEGSHDDLHKLLSCRKYGGVRDQCGRVPLLRAVLRRRRGLVMKLVTMCPFTLNMRDSLGRSVLHYANLFMDMLEMLETHGADPHLEDNVGRTPKMYSRLISGPKEFSRLQREALDADLDIYIYNTNFEEAFHQAMKKGDLRTIRLLVAGLKENGDVSRFSYLLFGCVDLCRENIALYLLNAGLSFDIWKRYVKCDPSSLVCSSTHSYHPLKSLKQRAMETGCTRVVQFINKCETVTHKVDLLQQEATSMLNYGLM